jgi:hypothetical protein
MIDRPELFPQPDASVAQDANEGIAALIAANASAGPYASQEERARAIVDARGEDLGAEQTGFKQVEPPQVLADSGLNRDWREAQRRPARTARVHRPITNGPIRGESEGEQVPAGRDTEWKLDPTTKAIGRAGVNAARSALTGKTS